MESIARLRPTGRRAVRIDGSELHWIHRCRSNGPMVQDCRGSSGADLAGVARLPLARSTWIDPKRTPDVTAAEAIICSITQSLCWRGLLCCGDLVCCVIFAQQGGCHAPSYNRTDDLLGGCFCARSDTSAGAEGKLGQGWSFV
jgi:hypothetical protein